MVRDGNAKLMAELEEVRKNNARLQKQITALQAEQPKGDDMELDEDADATERARDERIKVLGDNLKGVALVFSEDSSAYKEKKAELDELLRAKRDTKPLNIQIQRVDQRIRKQKNRVNKIEEDIEEDRKQLRTIEARIADSQQELVGAKTTLGQLEEERKQLLLREAKTQQPHAGTPTTP